MTKRGYVSTDSPIVSARFHAVPHALIRLAHRRASFPRGKLLYRAFGWYHSTARVVFATWLGGAPRSESKFTDCRGQSHLDSIDESSPLHYVVPFNHTGYIRNVAGGRLPPLRTHRLVIPFIRTGCIRGVSGTAHRPFPTVSLTRPFLNHRDLKRPFFDP